MDDKSFFDSAVAAWEDGDLNAARDFFSAVFIFPGTPASARMLTCYNLTKVLLQKTDQDTFKQAVMKLPLEDLGLIRDLTAEFFDLRRYFLSDAERNDSAICEMAKFMDAFVAVRTTKKNADGTFEFLPKEPETEARTNFRASCKRWKEENEPLIPRDKTRGRTGAPSKNPEQQPISSAKGAISTFPVVLVAIVIIALLFWFLRS